jgi:hypothetical protein
MMVSFFRPLKHYARNVRNLILGRPYRKGKQEKFRHVHRQLARAMQSQHRIVLSLIRNIMPSEDINAVEREEQARHGCPLLTTANSDSAVADRQT